MFYLPTRRRTESFARIPGPRPVLLLGNAHRFIGSPPWRMKPPWRVCERFARQFGDLTRIWLLGQPTLILNHPDLIEQVLVTKHESFYKDDPIPALKPLTPNHSLFLSNGPAWRGLREHHPFSVSELGSWLERQTPVLADFLAQRVIRLAEISAAEPIEMMPHLQRMTFDAFAVAALGEQLDDHAYRDFSLMGQVGARRMQMPVHPLPPLDPRFYDARRRWNNRVAALVHQAKNSPDPSRDDLLHRYPWASSTLSDAALRVLVGNIFYGGVFSATSCVVSTLRLLDEHAEVGRRLDRELGERFGADKPISLSALNECTLLDRAVRESMRVQPPVPIFMRSVGPENSVELGGHTIPADTAVAICPGLLHRSPLHWDNAERFVPDRWAGEVTEQNPPGSRWFFPFGRGPRMCVGMEFAICYIKLAVAMLRRQSGIEVYGGKTWQETFFFGVMVPKGLRMKLRIGTSHL